MFKRSDLRFHVEQVSVPEGSIALLLGACDWSKYSPGSSAGWKNAVSLKLRLQVFFMGLTTLTYFLRGKNDPN